MTFCENALSLPSCDAPITSSSPAATSRRPVTANSRATMMSTTHALTRPSSTSAVSAPTTSSLSASGSRNVPPTLVQSRRRARKPSSESVDAAMA